MLFADDRLVDSLKNSPHTSTGTPRDDATPGTTEMSNFSSLHYQDGINPVRCASQCSSAEYFKSTLRDIFFFFLQVSLHRQKLGPEVRGGQVGMLAPKTIFTVEILGDALPFQSKSWVGLCASFSTARSTYCHGPYHDIVGS